MSVAGKEFVMTHVAENVSNMKEGVNYFSEVKEHFNVPWRMCITRKNGFLAFYLHCDQMCETIKWSIDTERESKLISVTGKSVTKTSSSTLFGNTGENRALSWGWKEFIKWEDLEKDYAVDDKVIIEAHVKMGKTTGIPKKKLRNFDETMKELSDVTVVVDNQKFYVSKLFLATQSTYFKSLFLGNFKESEMSEVPLPDISSNDFQNFLEVLHGESAFDDDNVEGILRLADMYDAQTAHRRCEEFLLKESQKTLKEKLQISNQYRMQSVKNNCLAKVNTVDDIRSILPGDLSKMDPSVAIALLQKSVSLHQ